MKQKKTTIITTLVLVAALGAALWLVKSSKDTRNKAFFAGATMQLLPSSLTAKVGEDLIAHVWVNSGTVSVTTTTAPATPTPNAANCNQQCPGSDGVLRSCTPPESDGSSSDSLCSAAGRVEKCGNQNWCCPQAGGTWTTTMTAGCTANLPATPTAGTVSGGNATVQNVKLYVCYDKKIAMPVDEIVTRITRNEVNGFDSIPLSFVEAGSNNKECLMATVVADNVSRLKSGNVEVMTLKFKAIAAGSGTIDIVADKSRISGNNTASNDMAISVDGVTGSSFVISENGAVATATTVPNATATTVPAATATTAPAATATTVPAATATTVPNATATIVPTTVPTEQLTEAPYLNFEMAFAGVVADSACAVDWPLTVSVRAEDGTMKTYEDVVPVKMSETAGSLQKYKVGLRLTGFNYTKKVAVFVKGPKHLQVKYGRDNQSTYYDQAGGEIDLTSAASTSPTYDFSGYPLLSGDVLSDSASQDGVVDGRDFSYVKTESLKRTESATGESMLADLNGNCKLESQDVATLMLSLSEKQEQLY